MSKKIEPVKEFKLILTTGNGLSLPLHVLMHLQEVGLVRIGKNGLARTKRGCVAYVKEGTDDVTFVLQKPVPIQHHAVKSSWFLVVRAFLMKVKLDKDGNPFYEGQLERDYQVNRKLAA